MAFVPLGTHRPVTSQFHRGFLGGAITGVGAAGRSVTRMQRMTTSAGLFDAITNLFKGNNNDSSATSSNNDVLKWARTAKPGCPIAPESPPDPSLQLATFAGGCFWGLELAYQRVEGVTKTFVGYAGGSDPSPTYDKVCSGRTGHTEIVQVYYDPKTCSYERLLQEFFDKVDPTTLNRQGNDRGTQYRSVIFYHNDAQKTAAEAAVVDVNKKLADGTFRRVWGTSVVTTVEKAGPVYIAEAYHQQYLARGGRFGLAQSAEKGCKDTIRCYG